MQARRKLDHIVFCSQKSVCALGGGEQRETQRETERNRETEKKNKKVGPCCNKTSILPH